tara:strand:- start:280 stop:540 length:261 start_codon:yes stop_codon:yes gene_type:complete
MDEKTLRALIDAGAIRRCRIVASGARFHIEFETPNGTVTACTLRKKIKQWATLDATARWLRNLGIGESSIDLARWTPGQKQLPLDH